MQPDFSVRFLEEQKASTLSALSTKMATVSLNTGCTLRDANV